MNEESRYMGGENKWRKLFMAQGATLRWRGDSRCGHTKKGSRPSNTMALASIYSVGEVQVRCGKKTQKALCNLQKLEQKRKRKKNESLNDIAIAGFKMKDPLQHDPYQSICGSSFQS
ncbi:hypothetical protein MRB53_031730 [Persea americana]|uniref:Uncharacterized protein n=1 Tax=Persea americana TaxID=3435 RepID=A0ACC2KPT8_PERAE|nr:hypothetical protein MRB53_031730 [Persea americana]